MQHLHAGAADRRRPRPPAPGSATWRPASRRRPAAPAGPAAARSAPGPVAEREPVEARRSAAGAAARGTARAQLGVGVPGEHVRGQPGAEPVGHAGRRVRLVHHDRHLAPLGRQVGGRRHVARRSRPARPRRTRSRIVPAACTAPASRPGTVSSCGVTERGSGTARDQRELVAAHRDQPGLQAPLGAQAGHLDAAVAPAAARRRAPGPARCDRRSRRRRARPSSALLLARHSRTMTPRRVSDQPGAASPSQAKPA